MEKQEFETSRDFGAQLADVIGVVPRNQPFVLEALLDLRHAVIVRVRAEVAEDRKGET